MTAKILIAGDLAPIGMAEEAIRAGNQDWFSDGLGQMWDQADFRVANLECPLIDSPSPPAKTGPSLGVVTKTAEALGGFSLIGLANNHILDHGEKGLLHTMRLLDKSAIPFVGAGNNLEHAAKPWVANINGIKVGFLAWSHREFCIATDESAGAFPIDLVQGLPILEKLNSECDFVILLYHGGVEHFPYPTPRQRQRCRFLASRGVDFIFCQHSHIVGAVERVGSSTIVYGQGNFCFDWPGKNNIPYFCSGIICELELSKSDEPKINIVPTVHSLDNGLGPAIANEEKAALMLQEIDRCSAILVDHDRYRSEWKKWCVRIAEQYLLRQIPVGRVGRKILKMSGIAKLLNTSNRVLWNLNRIECEAHSETTAAGLKEMAKLK